MKRVLKLLASASVILAAVALQANAEEKKSEDGMVPLKIDLPKPLFVGTPVKVEVPNLEKPLGKPRPLMMVPEGVTNLAAGKEVTSSDDFPIIGELDYITDGDKDGSEGYYVELGPNKQWVQIDLGQKSEITALVLWHFHAAARVYFDVVVQVSDDPDFIEGVKTIYNADHDNSSGFGVGKDLAYIETNEGRLIDAKGVEGRYVRLYSKGNTANGMNHYIEVEVYGKPVE